jgi:hypothetical protein
MAKGIKRTVDIQAARKMRSKGFTLPEIAEALKASKSSVHGWVKEVEISAAGKKRLARMDKAWRERTNPVRNKAWVDARKECRDQWRQEGREQAMKNDPHHAFACALYWGEGAKDKNDLRMCNSDISVLNTFVVFLKKYFGVSNDDLIIKLIAYTDCLPRDQVETYWENGLNIPGATFGPHEFDTRKYITRGAIRLRSRRLKYGTCYLRVKKGTRILQHIYGALEIYGGASLDHNGDHPNLVKGEAAMMLGAV